MKNMLILKSNNRKLYTQHTTIYSDCSR